MKKIDVEDAHQYGEMQSMLCSKGNEEYNDECATLYGLSD